MGMSLLRLDYEGLAFVLLALLSLADEASCHDGAALWRG